MKKTQLILILIVMFGLFLRLILLGSIPTGFTPDESSQAYSAYSLLKTGKDEWGTSWPIASFKSFLDYKAPLQTYLMIPTIAIFGLNQFAARLPSAIFGVFAILSIYFLSKELFPKSKNLPLIAALFLSISPWHLQFSRMALEVNLTSFLFPLGLYFFVKGLKDRRFFSHSVCLWGISLYAYHSARVFIPLFSLSLLYLYRKKIFAKGIRPLLAPIVLILIIITPLAIDTLYGGSATRGSDLMIFNLSAEKAREVKDQSSFSDLSKISPKVSKVFHNKTVSVITQFSENYLSYFSLPFWFTESGNETTYSNIPGRGLLYFWMLPLIFFGLYKLIDKSKSEELDIRTLFFWMIIAAIPAALTREGYRPNRAGSFLGLWELIAAFGLVSILSLKFKFKKTLSILFIGLSAVLTIFYFEDYFLNTKVSYPKSLSYGWREAINFIEPIESEYKKIMIEQGTQGQTFVAFYRQVDPLVFQSASAEWNKQITQANTKYLDQIAEYNLGKYSFEALNWPEDINDDTLYLSQRNNILLPKERRTLRQIKTPTGEIIIEIFDFKK